MAGLFMMLSMEVSNAEDEGIASCPTDIHLLLFVTTTGGYIPVAIVCGEDLEEFELNEDVDEPGGLGNEEFTELGPTRGPKNRCGPSPKCKIKCLKHGLDVGFCYCTCPLQ